jgi:hypothetical protein
VDAIGRSGDIAAEKEQQADGQLDPVDTGHLSGIATRHRDEDR